MLRRRDFLTVFLAAACGRLLATDSNSRSNEWPVVKAKDAGFSEKGLEELASALEKGVYPNTHAVLIEYDGRLVFEKYLAGTDERWGFRLGERTFDADSLHDLRSASKSVTSALLGIALAREFDVALARPIGSFFPHLKLRPELNSVKLEHVLTMTAGLEWNEMTVPYTDPRNDEIQMSNVADPVEMVLSRPLREEPGTVWYYNGGLTQVLAGVVAQISAKPFYVFAREALFDPLDITRFEWLGASKWGPLTPSAASGLRMRARDLAKFGSVYLHRGKWQRRQIVPEGWVERSTQRRVQYTHEGPWGYGYQWWIGTLEGYDTVAACGNGNQRVFLVAKDRIAVTIFAGDYNKDEDTSEKILFAVMAARSEAPIPRQL
jgi:CubicO group peptidase (beta-lactamase class C family)